MRTRSPRRRRVREWHRPLFSALVRAWNVCDTALYYLIKIAFWGYIAYALLCAVYTWGLALFAGAACLTGLVSQFFSWWFKLMFGG
jgi:hypothetical protein